MCVNSSRQQLTNVSVLTYANAALFVNVLIAAVQILVMVAFVLLIAVLTELSSTCFATATFIRNQAYARWTSWGFRAVFTFSSAFWRRCSDGTDSAKS